MERSARSGMPDGLVKVFAVIGGITVLLIVLFLVINAYTRVTRNRIPSRTILEIDFSRGVVEYVPDGAVSRLVRGEQLAIRNVVRALDAASGDKRVLGAVARVGGTAIPFADVQELRSAVARFRASGKPAFAFAESFGELGHGNSSYYLASSFEQIYLMPSGSVGLTGIMSQASFLKGALDKLDLVPQLGARREYKTARNTLTQTGYTEEHREVSEAIVESVLSQMVQDISSDRNMSDGAFRELVTQGPFTARQALEAKLVDGLEYRDQVFGLMREKVGKPARFLYLSHYIKRRDSDRAGDKAVALIYGQGTIVQGRSRYNPLSGEMVMGSETVAAAFRAAIRDKDVGAIVFRVNSPGGSHIGSDVIWRETVRAREAGKAVIVSMGAVAGSGGYYVAADADKIIAQPSTITGSIGVVGGKIVVRGLYNKLGITFDNVKTSPNATIWSPNHEFTEEQWEYIQLWLDKVYDDFVTKVAKGRSMKKERVFEIAKGRIYTGAQALELGLVDTLGGFPAAFSQAKQFMGIPEEEKVAVKLYPRRRSWIEQLFGRKPESSEGRGSAVNSGLDWISPAGLLEEELNLRRGILLMEDPKLH